MHSCLQGKPSYCIQHRACNFSGGRLDGSTSHTTAVGGEKVHGSFFRQSSFATHALASERNVIAVEKSLPLATLAPLGCGVQTGAGVILNTFQVRLCHVWHVESQLGCQFLLPPLTTAGSRGLVAGRVYVHQYFLSRIFFISPRLGSAAGVTHECFAYVFDGCVHRWLRLCGHERNSSRTCCRMHQDCRCVYAC